MRIRPLLSVGLAFVALPSLACQVNGNLARNCGFDQDLTAWTVLGGTCVYDAGAGASKPGSVACASAPAGSDAQFVHLRQCVPATAGYYVFGANAQRLNGADVDCTVAAASHRTADCTALTDIASSSLTQDTETFARSAAQSLRLDASTRALSLDIACMAAAPFVVSFDDVLALADQIFKHGFEFVPPELTAGATLSYTENQAASAIDTTLTVVDGDSTTLTGASVQISANYASGADTLAFTPVGAITGNFSSGTGTLTLSGTDSPANYQTALRSVTFVNNSDTPSTLPRTVTWLATDPQALTSAPVTSTVNVTAVNDAPVVAGTSSASYTENAAASVLSNALTITDVDGTTLTGATVRISSNFDTGKDVLAFTPVGGITGSFTSDTLTLSGTASLATYQTALRSVTYLNNSENPSALTRSVTWQVNDGAAANNLSAAVISTIAVTAVNDAPTGAVPAGSPFAITGNVRRSLASGTLLAGASDPEGGALTAQLSGTPTNGATVVVNSNGSFTYNPAAGYEGAGSFQFVVCDAGPLCTAPLTVNVNISGMIWFINAGAAAGGTGRITDPFNTIAAFQAINDGTGNNPAANDNIFLYNGTYTGTMTLLAGQKLFGQGMSITLATATGITPPAGSVAFPATAIANRPNWTSSGTTLMLGSGNTLRGFNIGNSTTAKISGTNFGTLTVNEVALSGTGKALDFTTGAFSAASAFDSIASTSSGTQGISMASITAGTLTIGSTTISGAATQGILIGTTQANVSFGNTSVSAATDGISLQNNSAGTRSFGTLSITNGSGVSFLHGAGGGLTSITGAATITNPGAECIFIQNAAAANGVTFANVNCTQSGASGVRLLTNAAPITFADLDIVPDSNIGALLATDNTAAITTTSGTFNSSGAAVQVSGASTASRTPLAMVLDSVTSNGGTNNVALTNVSGSLTMNGGALSSATAAAFSVTGSTASVSYAGSINNFHNGIVLTNNTGGNIAFSGGMQLFTSSNTAFTATGGGTVTATQNNTSIVNTLNPTGGTALNIANTTIGAAGLTFRNIISTNGSTGIVLNNTGAGTLSVVGNGGVCNAAGTCSGGAIQNKTGDSISLTNTGPILLTDMYIYGSGQSHIDANGVAGLSLVRIFADTSTDHGFLLNNITNLVINGGTFDRGALNASVCNLDGFHVTNLLGTSSITGATFKRSNTRQFFLVNTSATNFAGAPDQLTVSNTSWNTHNVNLIPNGTACSGDHLSVSADTGGNFRLITNNTGGANVFKTGGTAVQVAGSGSGKIDASISGVTSGGTLASGDTNTAAVVVAATASSSATFDVFNNTSLGTGSLAIAIRHFTNGTFTGKVRSNTITHVAGAGTDALSVINQTGNGVGTVSVTNNTINGNFQRGIYSQAALSDGTLNLTVSNNTLTGTDATALQGIFVETGASGTGSGNDICLNEAANNVTMAGGVTAYRLVNRGPPNCTLPGGCTFNLQNFTGNGALVADVQAWVTTTKANIGLPIAVTPTQAFGTSAGCPVPP